MSTKDVRHESDRRQREMLRKFADRARTADGWALCITHRPDDDEIVEILGGRLTTALRNRMIARLQAARVYDDEVRL